MKTKLGLIALCLGLASSFAFADSKIDTGIVGKQKYDDKTSRAIAAFTELANNFRGSKDIISLSDAGFYAVRGNDNNMFFTTKAGRFFITGTIYDMYTDKDIKNVDELLKILQKTDFTGEKGGRQDYRKLATFTAGSGKLETYVFIDPNDPNIKRVFGQLGKYLTTHKFYFYLLPTLAEDSLSKSVTAYCHRDNPSIFKAVGSNNVKALGGEDCDPKGYTDSIILASMLNVTKTPTLFNYEGYRFSGFPVELKAFLYGKDLLDGSVNQ